MKHIKNVFFIRCLLRTCCLVLILWIGNISYLHAQEIVEPVIADSTLVIIADTIQIVEPVALPDSTVQEALEAADAAAEDNIAMRKRLESTFKPNSTRAVIYSAIFPGLGQIYNRQYWKLPIVYGGVMGFLYAITWNNRMYQDYSNAYMSIVSDAANLPNASPDQWSDSWKVFIKDGNYEAALTNTTFQNGLKRNKDYYRRYRDLSIILSVGFYALCMLDAYVDAEMFDFDVSPDLSMRIEPMILPRTGLNEWTFGLNYSITF